MSSLLSNAAALWNLILLLVVVATLAAFLYGFIFRRLLRARKIAGARDRRLLRQAAERESDVRGRS